MQVRISAFVITYNRASLLETCLRAVSFADELIVIDKSSTDNSAVVAARYADRVEIVPWSPTVEETRAFASSLCQNEWVLFLDDDEILSSGTETYLRNYLAGCEADILAISLRHYILGVHDERAYYWPEEHHRLFRKGALEFIPTVHGGVAFQSDRIASIPADSGVCIHHLSYQDVASWIERTNRYTSRPDRVQVAGGEGNLIGFAHDRIDYWMQRTTDPSSNDYPTAVALLRAIYDMTDRLKAWEKERGLDGAEMFRTAQKNLVEERELRTRDRERHGDSDGSAGVPVGFSTETASLRDASTDQRQTNMQAMLVQLRSTEAQLRARTEAERKVSLGLINTRKELDDTTAEFARMRNEFQTMLANTKTRLDETRETLDETRETLEQTRETLEQTRERLERTQTESDRLSNSARLFVRQYMPKLRRHILKRLG
jgi:glycosyltransferase involved in cell wall biosynthesis